MKLWLGLAGLIALGLGVVGLTADDHQGIVVRRPYQDFKNSGQAPTKSTTPTITFHGGPVITSATSVYLIYYGTFTAQSQAILNDFMSGLSGSPQYQVQTKYYDASNVPVPGVYSFTPPSTPGGPSAFVYYDNYSLGQSLNSNNIATIVQGALRSLPVNENAVYMVLTAPDVKVAGFCTSYCAYHTFSSGIYAGKHIRYALIPYVTQKCSACDGNVAVFKETVTPNGDMGADAMTDSIFHELTESNTDPDLNAWYTSSGAENADLCNYQYGPTFLTSLNTGGTQVHANAHLGVRDFLIQMNWRPDVTPQVCAQRLP